VYRILSSASQRLSDLELLVLRARKAYSLVTVPEYRRAIRFGVAPSIEHAGVPFQATYATVVDAGAARGQFALLARRRYPAARIICFEPLPEAQATLQRLFESDSRIEVHGIALGARSGTATLNVSGQDDSSSLLSIGAAQEREYPGTGKAREQAVRVQRLDEVIERVAAPALLKIDVQGSELELLRGAGDLLSHFDDILVECSFAELYEDQPLATEVLDLLFGHELQLVGVFDVQRGANGTCLQADFLLRCRTPS